MSEQPWRDNFLAISILIASFVIGGSLIYGAGVKELGRSDGRAEVASRDEKRGSEASITTTPTGDDDVILGDQNAPVTMIEFIDYQCPFCAKVVREVLPTIREKYVETGKVKLVIRDFPLDSIHSFARTAAEASECAAEQGAFWGYHDLLFERQAEIPAMDFVSLAGELGLNREAFRSCYEGKRYADEVEKDYQDGIAAGVRGTPTTFINGALVSGAVPLSQFEAAIEAALNASGE